MYVYIHLCVHTHAGTAYEAELHRGWDLLPHDDDDLVSTKDLVQHIVQGNIVQHTATYCNTRVLCKVTLCDTLQHTATHACCAR